MLTQRRFFTSALLLLLLVACSTHAQAHQIGLSKGMYKIQEGQISVTWDLAQSDLLQIWPALDTDRDRLLSPKELAAALPVFQKEAPPFLQLHADTQPCKGRFLDAKLIERDGIALSLHYLCPQTPKSLFWRFSLFERLAFGHRHFAQIHHKNHQQEHLFYRHANQHQIQLNATPKNAPSTHPSSEPTRKALKGFGFFLMGIEHILIGFDHLLFLFALLLLGGTWRSLLLVITSFTVAHSITLSIAALGIWQPSSRWVEAAIALSIVYVGVENIFFPQPRYRWLLTFALGLVHGFGFAGVLAEIGIPQESRALSLFFFNLGVEVGQIAVLLIVLPLLMLAHRKIAWFETRGVLIGSLAVVAMGAFWFVQRIL
jgi:hydrogenase/urease accessory protein HupE